MQDVDVKLNTVLSTRRMFFFYQQTGLKFKEETSKLLYFESLVWCLKLDASGSRSEMP
jgi:hypothetical protein